MEFRNSSNQVVASISTSGNIDVAGSITTNGSPIGGASVNALDDIADVNAPSPSSGDYLKWSGSAWINDPINLGTDTTGNYMVNVSAGTGMSVSHTQGEGSTATVSLNANLDALTDVAITSPVLRQVVKYNGTSWVNLALGIADISSFQIGAFPVHGEVLKYDSGLGKWVNSTNSFYLDDLSDVNTGYASNGKVLTYSNGFWEACSAPGRVLVYSNTWSNTSMMHLYNTFSNAYSKYEFELEYYNVDYPNSNTVIAFQFMNGYYYANIANYSSHVLKSNVYGGWEAYGYENIQSGYLSPLPGVYAQSWVSSNTQYTHILEGKIYYPASGSRATTLRASGTVTASNPTYGNVFGIVETSAVYYSTQSVDGIRLYTENRYDGNTVTFGGTLRIYGVSS